jgi:tight adherence protein C
MLSGSQLIGLLVFLGMATLGLGFFWWYSGDRRRALTRLRGLSLPEIESSAEGGAERGLGGFWLSWLPRVGTLLAYDNEERLARLRARLLQAGMYNPQIPRFLLGLQLLLFTVGLLLAALVPSLLGLLPQRAALLTGFVAGAVGLIAPGLWLDARKKRRQSGLRRALPDALDMLVLCLEGGMSLAAAVQRVTSELRTVHPLLAAELAIVQRETQMGLSTGEALRKFAQRSGLEEVQELASVLLQSEHFGASVVKTLRAHADGCRTERQQRAEEMAQKAAVKILFPTLLCIFPAVFIVILGPAAYQIAELLSRLR